VFSFLQQLLKISVAATMVNNSFFMIDNFCKDKTFLAEIAEFTEIFEKQSAISTARFSGQYVE
jgi:hypothetical protein